MVEVCCSGGNLGPWLASQIHCSQRVGKVFKAFFCICRAQGLVATSDAKKSVVHKLLSGVVLPNSKPVHRRDQYCYIGQPGGVAQHWTIHWPPTRCQADVPAVQISDLCVCNALQRLIDCGSFLQNPECSQYGVKSFLF